MIHDDPSHSSGECYPVNPFDLATDLFSIFSDQVIHLVMHLDGPIRYEILKLAVAEASTFEPITRCRIIREQDTLFWQEIPSGSWPDPLLRISSHAPGEEVCTALSLPLDPGNGRLFQVILIEEPGGSGDILLINMHHIVMDARGLKDFAGLILQCYAGDLTGQKIHTAITPLRSHELPRIATLAERRQPSPESQAGWSSRISVPLRSLHTETFQYSLLTLSPSRTSLIRDARRRWGITVNDCLIAVLARAIAGELPVQPEMIVPLYFTVDLRRYLPNIPGRSLVNFSTSCEVTIPVLSGEPLEITGKRVHLLMNQVKSRGMGLDEASAVEELFDAGYTKARDLTRAAWESILSAGSKTTIFSNTGIIRGELVTPPGLFVRNAYFLPSFFQPPGFFFLLSTFAEKMTISASYAVPAYDPEMVRRIFSSIDAMLPGYSRYPGEYTVLG